MNKSASFSKTKKKKSVKTMKHKKKHKSVDTDEDSDDLSPNKAVHSISHYMNDRPEMLDQMFSTLSEEKLRAMLPPLLKDESIDNLRRNCLEALLGMSSKRIKSVISGDDLGSQSSDTDDSSSSDESNEDDTSKRPVTDEKPQKTTETTTENEGQSLLEIIELQLRARAIRAALVHQCASDPPSPEPELTKQEETIIEVSDEESNSDKDTGFRKPVKKAVDEDDNGFLTNAKGTNGSLKAGNAASGKKTDDAIVFSKGNVSGPSKRNVVIIGPSKKSRNKIKYLKQSASDDSSIGVSTVEGKGGSVKANEEAVNDKTEDTPLEGSGEISESAESEDVVKEESQGAEEVIEEKMEASEDSKTVDEAPIEESWVGRWLQQPENQAAKKNSKIITSIKKKLQTSSKKKAESESEPLELQPSEPLVLLGTVNEYDLLPSTTVISDNVGDDASPSCRVNLDAEPEDSEVVTADESQATSKFEETAEVQEVLPLDPGAKKQDENDAACPGDELEIHYRETEDEMQQ